MFQESCAHPEVIIFHLGGDPSSVEEFKEFVMGLP